jgi:hypothetical protein
MKPKYSDFEVVFISRDTSAAEMDNYMAEMKMPWLALRWDAVKWSTKVNKYCGPGIPCLVVVNANGEVLSDSYNGSNYLGPHKALDGLRALLTQGGPAIIASSSAAIVSPAPAGRERLPHPAGRIGTKFSRRSRLDGDGLPPGRPRLDGPRAGHLQGSDANARTS